VEARCFCILHFAFCISELLRQNRSPDIPDRSAAGSHERGHAAGDGKSSRSVGGCEFSRATGDR